MALKRRHDLRYDNSSCKPLSEEHQLVGQCSAAHERNAGVDHARKEVARLFDEPCSGYSR